MVKIVWSFRAIDDLTIVADYSSKYSEIYASSIITRLFNKVDIFEDNAENRKKGAGKE